MEGSLSAARRFDSNTDRVDDQLPPSLSAADPNSKSFKIAVQSEVAHFVKAR